MKAEEWLLNIRGMETEIEELKKSYRRTMERATNVTSASIGEKVMSSPKNSSEEKLAEVSDYALLIAQAIQRKEKLRREAFMLIERLGNKNLRMLLRLYYLDGYTWEQTAERMGMSVRHVSGYMKNQALAQIERLREQSSEP